MSEPIVEIVAIEPTEEPVKKSRKTRSPEQLAVLHQAREKAMVARRENADITRKAREVKQFEKEQKKKEVLAKYDAMVKTKATKEQSTPPPAPPEPEPEPEPEPMSRPPSPEPELIHDPEPEPPKPVRSYQVKSRGPSQPIPVPQPRAPPAYKAAFEKYMGYM